MKQTKRQPLRQHKRLRLDRRADQILADEPLPGIGHNNPPPDDELLTTEQVAAWLRVTVQWLEFGRVRGYGPQYTRLGPRAVRYTRGQVRAFLRERVHASTSEYGKPKEVA